MMIACGIPVMGCQYRFQILVPFLPTIWIASYFDRYSNRKRKHFPEIEQFDIHWSKIYWIPCANRFVDPRRNLNRTPKLQQKWSTIHTNPLDNSSAHSLVLISNRADGKSFELTKCLVSVWFCWIFYLPQARVVCIDRIAALAHRLHHRHYFGFSAKMRQLFMTLIKDG